MTHPAFASSTTGFGAVLALATALLAAQAHADITVYQDTCNGNDFSSRYTFNSVNTNVGYSSDFPASSGNKALAEQNGVWNGFQTTSYANGNFANTSYTLTLAQYIQSSQAQQSLGITLLNNGYTTGDNYAGYRFGIYIDSTNAYYAFLERNDATGTATPLVGWSRYTNSKVVDAWSNLTLSVETTASATNLTLYWSGLDDGGSPYSYQVFSYSDTSASRYVSGSGLGIEIKGAANTHGYFLDNLTVTAVPEPACLSLLALGGLALLRPRRN